MIQELNHKLNQVLTRKQETQRRLKMTKSSNLSFCLGEKTINSVTHKVSWIIWRNDGSYMYVSNYYWQNDITPFKTVIEES